MTATPRFHPRYAPSEPMPSDDTIIVAQARTLQRDALAGRTQPLLRGKNIGLVCESFDGEEAQLFRRAAAELGAHVAHVRPVLSEGSPAQEVRHTGRLLGRLYDAVECQGMPAGLVRQLADGAGVPVYLGLATAAHPSARLAELLEGDDAPGDKRRFVLQAVLLTALA